VDFDGFSVRDEVFDWVFEAERDVERARKLFELGDYSMACSLSQQAIERALRAAVMALLRESPPRVHDLTVLYSMVRGNPRLRGESRAPPPRYRSTT